VQAGTGGAAGRLARFASAVSGRVGRERAIIRFLRPVYDALLLVASGGRGIWWTVNGSERFRIDPFVRRFFPPEYDRPVHEYLRTHVEPGATLLNVGANLGIYALCLAQWTGPSGRVFAFEPSPRARGVLERHVAMNRLTDRVRVVGEAVSSERGEATFFAAGLEGYSRLGAPNPALPGSRSIRVPVTTIDEFCARERIAPAWIVIDIEGYEVAALRGARATIGSSRGRIGLVVELHPGVWQLSGTSRADLERLLAELDLEPVGLTGQHDPLGEYGIVLLRGAARTGS